MGKRSKFQRIILLILAAMLVVFSVLLAVTRAHKGVEFEGALLAVTEGADGIRYHGTAHGDLRLFALAVVLLGMAAVLTAFPTELFRLKYRWDVKDPEPTEFYYGVTYAGAVVLAGTALVGFIMSLRYFPAP